MPPPMCRYRLSQAISFLVGQSSFPPHARVSYSTNVFSGRPLSPSLSSANASPPLSFIDGNPTLQPDRRVSLSIGLGTASLGLRTKARTSFITYWLPSFQRHRQLLLRFVPQAAYELSAPLCLSSDLTIRVFLLFQGLSEVEAVDSR
ncbi:hypothetical protein BDY24DRAFT_418482 [Mrakia frigida]|uniref:uncharacterized protein n=1 Tax=Mrakia frigida TaxID=29902 RepID=UPI003FCC1FF8